MSIFCISFGCSKISTTHQLNPGQKIKINQEHYFVYAFNQKPRLGTIILKVSVYDSQHRLIGPYDVLAQWDMPSMKGSHHHGIQTMEKNRKSEYLIPIDFVMPGLWRIELKIRLAGTEVYAGEIDVAI